MTRGEAFIGLAILLWLIVSAASAISAQVFSGPPVPGSVSAGSVRFADAEVPSATSTLVYQLARTPAPVDSLQVFLNGMLLKRGADYSLTAGTITFVSQYTTMLSEGGNAVVVFYRY